MNAGTDESLLATGDPLGFRIRQDSGRSAVVAGAGKDVFRVEARALAAQQKEAILAEGGPGSLWRLSSDEGPAMRGDDIAPFPLAFLIAGVTSDLYNRIRSAAGARLGGVEIGMSHRFGSAGSFIRSTATASSEAVELRIALSGEIDSASARAIVAQAINASPAIRFLREPMGDNRFALYLNGRRRKLLGRPDSAIADVLDPFLAHSAPPRPSSQDGRTDLIGKPGTIETGEAQAVPLASPEKRYFTIAGIGRSSAASEFVTDSWIARPGMSHFRIVSDEGPADAAPSGLGLLSAGIAFCYLTQLHRYIDAQKLAVQRPRLVQFTNFDSRPGAGSGAIDTHLFLNGEAPEELHSRLLTMAAHTCFMHAAAAGSVEPRVAITLNGVSVA